MPRVSVLMAIHADTIDKVTWLREAIESVQRQTMTDWELIAVDDQSSQDLEPVKEHFKGDGRVRWFRMAEQSGPALCRNTAAALAEAEALLALDADDQLAEDNVLTLMLEAWGADKTQVIYGDLQRLEWREGNFTRGRLFSLPAYTFERVKDLNGIIPVTALHSKECHQRAGGWKPTFEAGLEDVEYWISAGKAGCCGMHIPVVTLLYRQHQTSRAYRLRRVSRREAEMRNSIRDYHRDVYEGRYPMGCCGGRGGGSGAVVGSVAGAQAQQQSASSPVQRATSLDQYGSAEKVWVSYKGNRQASFGVAGKYTGMTYTVEGPGHKLEVHVNDLALFRRSGRGRDFDIGVAPPTDTGAVPEPAPEPETNDQAYEPPAPAVATIERLDKRAVEVQTQMEPEPAPEPVVEPEPVADDLSVFKLGPQLEGLLSADGWTIAKLAEAEPGDLTQYKGIGAVRASKVIGKARELV